ncbi:hypothetical protein ACIRQP_29925 [Streptomyces sp. NPDC102274]
MDFLSTLSDSIGLLAAGMSILAEVLRRRHRRDGHNHDEASGAED